MWVVEVGTAYMGTEHFTVESTHRFRLKRRAKEFFDKYAKRLKGGQGYWQHMPYESVRMYPVKRG